MKFLVLVEQTLTFIFWVLLIFGFDTPYVAALTVITALIHEIGHIVALYIVKGEYKSSPRAAISGFRIQISNLSYKQEMVCALAGPFANLAVGLLSILIFKSEYTSVFCALNVMTMISNLLPIKGYDGYKFVLCAASLMSSSSEKAEIFLDRLSFTFSVLATFFSLYLILKLGEGYWIFGVFFSVLLSEIIKRQKHTIYEKK